MSGVLCPAQTHARVSVPFCLCCSSCLFLRRHSTIKNSDCILVLAKGKIVEQGTHDELLALHGQYRKMWDVQQRIELHKQQLQRMESLSLNDYAYEEGDLDAGIDATGDGKGSSPAIPSSSAEVKE